MINTDYVKNHLTHHKIIFPTNTHDNKMAGFQNYGPHGLTLKSNIINIWRDIFVGDNVYEIDCPVISHECVLKRSGHVAKFNDLGLIFTDIKTNKIDKVVRADHFVEDKSSELAIDIAQVCLESADSIRNFVESNGLYDKSTHSIEIIPISLMFKIPSVSDTFYLRPEIAQTIFVEFKQIYDYAHGKLPLGIAQVGKSYRNEISDKPFVRLREFTQAEVEWFFNPEDPFDFSIPAELVGKSIEILSAQMQTGQANTNTNSIRICFEHLPKYVSNPIVQMFIVKLYEFAEQVGLDMNKIRFRQHRPNEMAHYAKDCWDMEANIFGKWLEISGLAHRSNYDLSVHDTQKTFYVKKSNCSVKKLKLTPNSKKIFELYSREEAINLIKKLETIICEPDKLELNNIELYTVSEFNDYEYILPSVIEPSIGIDRVFYTLIAHRLELRPGTSRPVLILQDSCKIYDFMLAQLSNHEDLMGKFDEFMRIIKNSKSKLKVLVDKSSTSIGKRYTRADEIGVRYTITIDFDTLKDNTVTLRDSWDMSQSRLPFAQALELLS